MARVVLQYKYCIAGWKGHEAGWLRIAIQLGVL